MTYLSRRFPFLVRMSLSVVILAIFSSVAFVLQPILHGNPLFLLLAAVILCSLFGGFVVGLITSLLATMVHNYFFQMPLFQVTFASVGDVVELFIFLTMAIFMNWVGSSYRKALILGETLRKNTEAEKRSREDVLAVVSHDLKNPLSAIQMNAQLIANLSARTGNSEVEKRVDSIQHIVGQMSHLIRDLQDFEKLRAGTYEVRLQRHHVNSLLQEVSTLMTPIAAGKKVEVKTDPQAQDLLVDCDAERILQVLSNLIGNAIKFTASGGSVNIKVSQSKSEVIFRVQDTGSGISEDQLPHIFDRYWQAKQTSRQGVGLGLAISHEIVKAHGGRIWVTSKIGEGSSFYFTLKPWNQNRESQQSNVLKAGSG